MSEGYEPNPNGNTETLNGTVYITTDTPYGTQLYPFRNGSVIFVDFALRSSTALPEQTDIAKVTLPKNLVRAVHLSSVTNQGNGVRLVMSTNGTISLESAWNASEWISGTFIGLI